MLCAFGWFDIRFSAKETLWLMRKGRSSQNEHFSIAFYGIRRKAVHPLMWSFATKAYRNVPRSDLPPPPPSP